MKVPMKAVCAALLLVIPLGGGAAAPKREAKGPPAKLERLACKLGTEDRHARIAVELIGGKVREVAYYSKWKPRTCSVQVIRGDSYSKWEDTGTVTRVTFKEDKGAFLIDHEKTHVKFLFREIDRERFCGMEGKITGSLTVWRGKDQCELDGIMDEGVPLGQGGMQQTSSGPAAASSTGSSAGD